MTVNEMPNDDMKLIAELCGVDMAMKLMKNFAGLTIYIPSMPQKTSGRTLKESAKKKYLNGESIKKIALSLKVSESYVYKLVKK